MPPTGRTIRARTLRAAERASRYHYARAGESWAELEDIAVDERSAAVLAHLTPYCTRTLAIRSARALLEEGETVRPAGVLGQSWRRALAAYEHRNPLATAKTRLVRAVALGALGDGNAVVLDRKTLAALKIQGPLKPSTYDVVAHQISMAAREIGCTARELGGVLREVA